MDQELSLFYDAEQTLSASDLERPLPDPNMSCDTRNICQASNLYLIGGTSPNTKPEQAVALFELWPTLNQILKDFVHGTLLSRVPSRHLQLLLHPLQALVHHAQNLLTLARCSSSPALSESANTSLLETQRLLRAWHSLAIEDCNENVYMHDTTLSLIIYHFICLNLAASFVDIERLADRVNLSTSFWQRSLQNEKCIHNRQEAIFHCGQALRYLRAVNADLRPWWWPTAVHRAILTLWAASTLGSVPSHDNDNSKTAQAFPARDVWPQGSMDIEPDTTTNMPTPDIIAIDNITPEDLVFSDAHWSERYMLVLTHQDEGVVALTDAMGILEYGISLIQAFPSSFEGAAVITKLKDLGRVWGGR